MNSVYLAWPEVVRVFRPVSAGPSYSIGFISGGNLQIRVLAIMGLYAAGLTVRDIQTHLFDLYGLKVSPELIRRVTDAVLDDVREWQGRLRCSRCHPRGSVRGSGPLDRRERRCQIPTLGDERDEEPGGVQDILIAIVDGLKGFPQAITAAFPDAMVQTCIVHLLRHSLNFCAWKDRKTVAADLRWIHSAPTAEAAEAELDAFEKKWAGKCASIVPAWHRAWQEVIPFLGFDPFGATIDLLDQSLNA